MSLTWVVFFNSGDFFGMISGLRMDGWMGGGGWMENGWVPWKGMGWDTDAFTLDKALIAILRVHACGPENPPTDTPESCSGTDTQL